MIRFKNKIKSFPCFLYKLMRVAVARPKKKVFFPPKIKKIWNSGSARKKNSFSCLRKFNLIKIGIQGRPQKKIFSCLQNLNFTKIEIRAAQKKNSLSPKFNILVLVLKNNLVLYRLILNAFLSH